MTIVAAVAVVVAAVIAIAQLGRPSASTDDSKAAADVLVRPDSHRLSTGDEKVTVVEFLDLECGACGAAFPGVEQLREEYGDRVTFVMRYFPLPSHRNGELAALAVEAAGQQGQLEAMYRTMFETQPRWAGQQVSHRETFLGFARELGLDMVRFEAALDDPTTLERVMKDRQDGIDLGVQGTPTFFVNGVLFDSAPTYEALKAAIDEELAR